MNRLQKIYGDRTEARRRLATSAAERVVDGARRAGLDVCVIGSLARDQFRSHSDVDFFVRGETGTTERVLVERLVADAFRNTSISYDVVYETDLTKERAEEFLGA